MFKEISPEALTLNPFVAFNHDWALVTAGDQKGFNTMTVSWGEMGILWNKKIVTVFVRPQRYTHQFMEQFDHFTLSFYQENYRDQLKFCGRHSGRDVDKVQATGLTPIHKGQTTYFEEAQLVLTCKKIYTDEIKPTHFCDETINNEYPDCDYHTIYVGEITQVLEKI